MADWHLKENFAYFLRKFNLFKKILNLIVNIKEKVMVVYYGLMKNWKNT